MKRIIQIGFILLFTFSLVKYNKSKEEAKDTFQRNEGTVFGTIYHIIYESEEDLHINIKAELKKFDNSLSMFNKQSILSRVNQNDSTVMLDEWTEYVITKGIEISENTGGAFDMTVAPLVNAWGFGFKKSDSVTPELIDSLRSFIGYKNFTIEYHKVNKADERTQLDASAIAKGYACDIIAQFLASKGIENYMVEIGGEVTAKGKNTNDVCWRIGINKPIEDNSTNTGEIEEVVQLCDAGMATSGNYRNFYYKDGKKVAHTIDPRTGYPVEHSLLSATVIASNCLEADAYATAFMVLGLEESLKLAQANTNIAAFFIYDSGDGKTATATTDNFESYLVKE